MPKIGCFWAFSHFFSFLGPFFENLEPKICFFIHQMLDEISQMTNICQKFTQNRTFKFYQKRNCPLSNARWGSPLLRHVGQTGRIFSMLLIFYLIKPTILCGWNYSDLLQNLNYDDFSSSADALFGKS